MLNFVLPRRTTINIIVKGSLHLFLLSCAAGTNAAGSPDNDDDCRPSSECMTTTHVEGCTRIRRCEVGGGGGSSCHTRANITFEIIELGRQRWNNPAAYHKDASNGDSFEYATLG